MTTLSQDTGTSAASLRGDSNTCFAEQLTYWPASTIESISLYLKKQGSPTGYAYCRVWDTAGTLLQTIGQIDVATLTTSFAIYTFNTTPYNQTGAKTIRIGIEYSGGNLNNAVNVEYASVTNPYTHGLVYYYSPMNGWASGANDDLRWVNLTFTLLQATTSLEATIHGANIMPPKDPVEVQTFSTPILDPNPDRRYALLINISATDVDIRLGAPAENNKGIRLYAYGGFYEINKQNRFCGPVYGIHAGVDTKTVMVTEGQ